LLDEPFEGLAPSIVQDVTSALLRLKGKRSMILVEHDAEMVMSLADRIYVLVNGRVAFDGTAVAFSQNTKLKDELLGLGQPPDAPAASGRIVAMQRFKA
jgi:ABC-type branched-subunit amino acid transport system ATPase component